MHWSICRMLTWKISSVCDTEQIWVSRVSGNKSCKMLVLAFVKYNDAILSLHSQHILKYQQRSNSSIDCKKKRYWVTLYILTEIGKQIVHKRYKKAIDSYLKISFFSWFCSFSRKLLNSTLVLSSREETVVAISHDKLQPKVE